MIIRQATLQDVQQIYTIEEKCFSDAWSLESLEQTMSNPLYFYAVIEKAGQVIGYGGIMCVLDEGEITHIAIIPSERGKGIGKFLLQGMLSKAKERNIHLITLEVRYTNSIAQKLYESQGFSKIATREQYYRHPTEDAIIMQWHGYKNKIEDKQPKY